MYRAFLNKAIGSHDKEVGCLLLEKAKVYMIRGPPGVLQYCEKDKMNYLVLPFRGCGSPSHCSAPLKNFHLPSISFTDAGGKSSEPLAK
jgi:hypothetical protein